MKLEELSNKELASLVDVWIRGERDRKIMKRKLIDGITYERTAEEFDLSVSRTYRIVAKNMRILKQALEK